MVQRLKCGQSYELSCVSQNNEQLKNQLQKQKEEAELFVQSIENELSEVKESEEKLDVFLWNIAGVRGSEVA